MIISILGCGHAFSKRNFNQTYLIEEQGRRMLIDYGYQGPAAIDSAGIDITTINDIYISHSHADHLGGLEQMAFLRYDWKNRPRRWDDNRSRYAPRLIANEQLVMDIWEKSLRGGLESMEGFVATLETFFEPVPIKPNKTFLWQGWECELVQQIHIMSGNHISSTFGLIMSKRGHKTVYFTTDCQHVSPKQVKVFYGKSDLIFQDCECTTFKSGVHAHYTELAGYPEANAEVLTSEVKGKMLLSHYQDFVSEGKTQDGKSCDWEAKAKKDGFLGWVHVGDVIKV